MGGRDLSAGPAAESDVGWLDRIVGKAGAGLLAALRMGPPEVGLRRGAAIGRAYVRAGGPRVGDARVNLRIAFPEWTEAKREQVLREAFEHLGRCVAEFAWMARQSDDALRERVRVEGVEHLEAAKGSSDDAQRGVIVLTAHLGNWELLGRAMTAHGYPLSIVHRGRDNPILESLAAEARSGAESDLLRRGNAARGALRALRTGRFLAMPYDQNCRRDEGVFVPFFGRLAASRVAPVRLAQKTGAPVLPVFIEREADGIHHVCRIRPVLPLVEDADNPLAAIVANARRMNRVIEDEIRRLPSQWIWTHRRWRTYPPGESAPDYS